MSERRLRGEGSIYQRESDDRWVGVVDLGWVAGKRVRRTVSAKTLKELRPKFKKLKQEVESGVISDDATVEEWMKQWLDHEVDRKLRPTTADTYRRYTNRWIIPHLGKRRLDRLRPDHIKALYAAMEDDGKSDSTRRQVHAILRRALVVAEREQRIASNPATKVDAPSVGKKTHGKLTLAQAMSVLAVLDRDDVSASRWACALLAGLRQSEALGLRWEDVDFEAGVLRIERSVQRVPKVGIRVMELKSESSYRAIPMVDPVRAALWAERQESGYVWGGERPIDPRRDWGEWKRVLKLAGVPDVPLHAARATTASLLMEAGVSEKLIAEILGHSQVQVTRKHYLSGDNAMHANAMGSLNTLITSARAEIGRSSAPP